MAGISPCLHSISSLVQWLSIRTVHLSRSSGVTSPIFETLLSSSRILSTLKHFWKQTFIRMLLLALLLVSLATRVLTAPSLSTRQQIDEEDIYPPTDIDLTEFQTIPGGLDNGATTSFDDAKPWELALGASSTPPAGFQYTTEPFDGYCLSGYQNCKICQKDTNQCYPAKRSSYTDDQGRTAWQLCETDVQTPPCTPYDISKVFTSN